MHTSGIISSKVRYVTIKPLYIKSRLSVTIPNIKYEEERFLARFDIVVVVEVVLRKYAKDIWVKGSNEAFFCLR